MGKNVCHSGTNARYKCSKPTGLVREVFVGELTLS